MVIMFIKNNKPEIINQYVKLLQESQNDVETQNVIQNIVEYHVNRGFDMSSEMVRLNGPLVAINYMYQVDLEASLSALKNASSSERENLENRIKSLELFLKDNEKLIKKEEQMKMRQVEMQKLEKKLSPEEIENLKNQYLISENETMKR